MPLTCDLVVVRGPIDSRLNFADALRERFGLDAFDRKVAVQDVDVLIWNGRFPNSADAKAIAASIDRNLDVGCIRAGSPDADPELLGNVGPHLN
jgi:hypothetical protein